MPVIRNRSVKDSAVDLPVDGGLRRKPARTKRAEASADVVAAFARHETFHPRYGWIRKGYDAAVKDAHVFLGDDASLRLGVGKNMVRAIRYWCLASKVLAEAPAGTGGGNVPTGFGHRLLGDGGLDPYLENPGSMWLLHWNIVGPPCIATAWYFAFNVLARHQFTVDELSADLGEYATRHFATARLASSSLRKDSTCIARMYADVPTAGAVGEDTIQCPFTELGLIRSVAPRTFAFNVGSKRGLTPWLITAAALQFAARSTSNARTVSLSSLLHSAGSPGLVFKLSEAALYGALEQAASADSSIGLTDAGGLIQLSFTESPISVADRLIERHYEALRPATAAA